MTCVSPLKDILALISSVACEFDFIACSLAYKLPKLNLAFPSCIDRSPGSGVALEAYAANCSGF